ncbi:MAG: pentapeptide repeat-containing protein [Oscillospiraceae bacterium]
MRRISGNMDEEYFSYEKLDGLQTECNWITACMFNHSVITNADFYWTVLCSSDFSYSKIKNSRFCKCDCDYTVFYRAEITDTEFYVKNSFMYADMRNAGFKNVLFYCSELYKTTDMSGCIFENTEFRDTLFDGIFRGTVFSDVSVTGKKYPQSRINIGSMDSPEILCGDAVYEWLEERGCMIDVTEG